MERKKATDFPQELLNMFDQYVHGDINRRQFLEGANRFAIGGLTPIGKPPPLAVRLEQARPFRR